MDSDAVQNADVIWRDGDVPQSARFEDPYFSLTDGLAETRHVFLNGNRLLTRFRPGFHIAELGFGTGLNLLTAWCCWEEAGQAGRLKFTSFEAFPLAEKNMERAIRRWPGLATRAEPLLAVLAKGGRRYISETLDFRLIVGDARQTVPVWEAKADAWFLDGFSPARNPAIWEAELMRAVARHTLPGGSFATYTAAGHVRRALEDAGFRVSRAPGYGAKRHMSCGLLVAS